MITNEALRRECVKQAAVAIGCPHDTFVEFSHSLLFMDHLVYVLYAMSIIHMEYLHKLTFLW